MSYATLPDLLGHMAESDLIDLTDDDAVNAIDQEVVDHVLADATAVVNSYCGRYALPFNPVPEMARILTTDIAVFNLYARRPGHELPEAIKERYRKAMEHLQRVQTGSASMGVDLPLAETGGSGGQSGLVPGNERIFRRDQTRWF